MPLEIDTLSPESDEGKLIDAIESVLDKKSMDLVINCVSTVLAGAYARVIVKTVLLSGMPIADVQSRFLENVSWHVSRGGRA